MLLRKAGTRMDIRRGKGTGTFIVKILDSQNATWQGSVTWAERQKVQYFRSALELLKMIDGVLIKDEGGES